MKSAVSYLGQPRLNYSIRLFDPVVGMFSKTAHEEVFFNAACDWYLDEYELAGLLVGLAVYNSVVLEVRLPVVAYKKLLVHNMTPSSLV